MQKVVLPGVWIPVFVCATALQFLLPPSAWSGRPPPREAAWFFLAATIAGSVFLYWFGMRLKNVSLDGDTLVISEFGRQARVPLRDVEEVSGSVFMRPELVWLRFRHPTEFGSTIAFMPSPRMFGGFTRHPLVAELGGLVAQASLAPRAISIPVPEQE